VTAATERTSAALFLRCMECFSNQAYSEILTFHDSNCSTVGQGCNPLTERIFMAAS
jgi:hypothetical protein